MSTRPSFKVVFTEKNTCKFHKQYTESTQTHVYFPFNAIQTYTKQPSNIFSKVGQRKKYYL